MLWAVSTASSRPSRRSNFPVENPEPDARAVETFQLLLPAVDLVAGLIAGNIVGAKMGIAAFGTATRLAIQVGSTRWEDLVENVTQLARRFGGLLRWAAEAARSVFGGTELEAGRPRPPRYEGRNAKLGLSWRKLDRTCSKSPCAPRQLEPDGATRDWQPTSSTQHLPLEVRPKYH